MTAVDGFRLHRPPDFATTRQSAIVTRNGLVGYVTVAVPFDGTLIRLLRQKSELAPADSLVIVRAGKIVASSPTVLGRVPANIGQTKTIAVGGGVPYLAAPAVAGPASVRFAVLTPSRSSTPRTRPRNRLPARSARVAGARLAGCLLRGPLDRAHPSWPGRGRPWDCTGPLGERVPVRGRDEFALLGTAFNDMANQLQARLAELEGERSRLRDAITRFGEALAATHDVDTLLRVKWLPDGKRMSVQTETRDQKEVRLYLVDAAGAATRVMTETPRSAGE